MITYNYLIVNKLVFWAVKNYRVLMISSGIMIFIIGYGAFVNHERIDYVKKSKETQKLKLIVKKYNLVINEVKKPIALESKMFSKALEKTFKTISNYSIMNDLIPIKVEPLDLNLKSILKVNLQYKGKYNQIIKALEGFSKIKELLIKKYVMEPDETDENIILSLQVDIKNEFKH